MKVRACLLILLLISQPLSAAAHLWQTSVADESAGNHCDTAAMLELQQSVNDRFNDSTSEQAECNDSCDLCAACAVVANADAVVDVVHPFAGDSPAPRQVQPPGETDLLYRPPILS